MKENIDYVEDVLFEGGDRKQQHHNHGSKEKKGE